MSGADDKTVHFATSIEYYAREGLFGHLQDECDRLREKRGDRDGAVLFWRAVALGMSSQVPAAMNALASLQGGNYRDFELASLVGQAHFNRAQVTTKWAARVDRGLHQRPRRNLSKPHS